MKILHISRNDYSGAGLCAYRLHRSLQDLGLDSKMIVLYKTQSDNSVYSVFKIRDFFRRTFHFILRKIGLYIFEYDKLQKLKTKYKVPFTRPVAPFDLSQHPLVRQADIIHLHWVDDFFNQKQFFNKVHKPIVWTVHDEGMFYGISHYHDMVFESNLIELKYRRIKLKMTKNAYKLSYVLLSQNFERTFGNHDILQNHDVYVIPNSVDCSQFTAFDKIESTHMLGLDEDIIYLSFLASNITDSHKGLDTLIEAVSLVGDERIQILAIGDNSEFPGNARVITPGRINDSELLSRYLSASDIFVMPSLQEAFSQAPIEAMACGKPVVVTPVSGTIELVNDNNGIICDGFTSVDIADGIKRLMSKVYSPEIIRNYVNTVFSPKTIALNYVSVYNSSFIH